MYPVKEFVNIAPNGLVSINANIIAIICVTVFNFPHILAATTSPFFSTAINLYPDTINSLIIIIAGIQEGILECSTNIIIETITNILSAIGSKNFPNVVIWFVDRAM